MSNAITEKRKLKDSPFVLIGVPIIVAVLGVIGVVIAAWIARGPTVPVGGEEASVTSEFGNISAEAYLNPENDTDAITPAIATEPTIAERTTEPVTEPPTTVPDNNPVELFQTGVQQIQTGNHNAAIRTYKEYLLLRPNDPLALNNLGIAYIMGDRYQEAIDSVAKGLACNAGKEIDYSLTQTRSVAQSFDPDLTVDWPVFSGFQEHLNPNYPFVDVKIKKTGSLLTLTCYCFTMPYFN